ncbi:ABC transporter ATP-binding protein [Oceanirhabdus seepicola]|uniref:ABC transporter ATP-binding protein n=1 Tax=Oceanirhabdus seepicola TaxID=2828781 RepID=A0A9J6NXM3_9CLOT|nr:ABC transporter ATP-binding protein [Oceanirhabdus seepicola]MCM1989011.1 ABC transporter ATP-binding protein [Oceanirhabdus seepicola]
MKNKKYFGSFVMKYLKGQRKTMILLAVFFIANIMLQIIAPQMLSNFIDSAKMGKTLGYISMIVLIYLGTIILKMASGVCESYFAQRFGWKITNSFRKDVLAHFLKIDMEHHERWTSGEVITRLDEDVEGLFTYFYLLIFKMVGSTLLMAGVLIVLALKNLVIAIAMFVFCIIAVWVFKTIQDFGGKLYVRRAAAISKFNGIMKERIDNVVEIRTNAAEEYYIHSLNEAMKKRFKESLPAGMMYSRLWSASTVLDAVATVLSLGIAVVLWDKGFISLGTVYLIHTYTELIYYPLQDFRNYLKSLQEAKAGLIRVREMLDIESSIAEGTREIDDRDITLTVRDLSFGYFENNDVINDICFELKPGERLGVMGETGSGKTTLAKLLARLYEFERGEILLNGVSVKALKGENLRDIIAYCTQDVQFLHGTLRDNITLYNEEFSDGVIHNAIKQMGLEQWFEKFPKGLDTYLEMAENNLSAGEAQLISIIRLFLKDPSIVILDEISSRLDFVTEQRILYALDVLTQNRTVITIAHKLSALRWTDNIMILNDGRIVEYGRKEELEKDESGRFYSMCKAMETSMEVRIDEKNRV